MDTKLDVDAIHILKDGTIGATHSVNKTVMLIIPSFDRLPNGKFDEKGNPIFEAVPIHKFNEPDNEERLYWLHRFNVITDMELETEMAKQPKQKKKDLIARLQQEVDNVPG